MRRIRIVGLCLVAVFAMGAVVATGASAANPEYGRCLKTKEGGGTKYTTAKCTIVASGEKENFEWYKAFGSAKPLVKTGFTAALKPTTKATLETKAGTKVTCTALSAAGKYTSNVNVVVNTTIFTGCESGGIKCNTAGSGTGEISVKELEGELGLDSKGETSVKDKIGNVLWPKGGTPTSGAFFVFFNCGGLTVEVKNSVISPVTSNAMKSIATVKFTASKGVQKPTKFLGGPNTFLESSFQKAPFEQSGQSATTLQTNEEKVEVRSL